MLTPIAYGLATAPGLVALLIGGRFLITPRAAAAGCGVPAKPGGDPAYLTIKGLRDGDLRPGGPGPARLHRAHAEAWFMLAAAIVPLGDTLIVLRHGGTRATAAGIHFTTAVLVLLSAAPLSAS